MYEQFKNQFALTLSATYSTDDIEVILKKLDMVSYNYEISKKETSVAVYNSEMPIEDISRLLGHESVGTTMIYAKVSTEDVQIGHKKYII